MPIDISPDDFVAPDGSVQTLTAADYAEAAAMMLDASETVQGDPDVPTAAL